MGAVTCCCEGVFGCKHRSRSRSGLPQRRPHGDRHSEGPGKWGIKRGSDHDNDKKEVIMIMIRMEVMRMIIKNGSDENDDKEWK